MSWTIINRDSNGYTMHSGGTGGFPGRRMVGEAVGHMMPTLEVLVVSFGYCC